MHNNDQLKIENQLCFPLYVCSKEIIKNYTPFLNEINITYTQYITMLCLWEKDNTNIKDLGKKLFLDSGTLTPLLKKLEIKGFITKEKDPKDGRNNIIKLTGKGKRLKESAKNIPSRVSKCIDISEEEAKYLFIILHKIMGDKK